MWGHDSLKELLFSLKIHDIKVGVCMSISFHVRHCVYLYTAASLIDYFVCGMPTKWNWRKNNPVCDPGRRSLHWTKPDCFFGILSLYAVNWLSPEFSFATSHMKQKCIWKGMFSSSVSILEYWYNQVITSYIKLWWGRASETGLETSGVGSFKIKKQETSWMTAQLYDNT